MAVEKAPEDGASDNPRDWTRSEDEKLLDFLINQDGQEKKSRSKKEKMDFPGKSVQWENAGIEGRTAQECHARWNTLVKFGKIYRTVKEIAEDLKSSLTDPALYKSLKAKDAKSHPAFPKAPPTAYLMFFADTRRKIVAEDPDGKHTAVSMAKIIGATYRTLKEKKKLAYNLRAKAARDEYQKKLDQFYRDHPMYREAERECDALPNKPTTPLMEFARSKLENGDEYDDEEQVPADLKAELKKAYSKLKPKKKVKYIKKALAYMDDYADQLAVFTAMHPESKKRPAIKQICTKEEFKMLDGFLGEPKKPPTSGYSVFCQEQIDSGELEEKNSKERMLQLAEMWKEVDEYEKSRYSLTAAEAKLRYAQEKEDWKQKSGGDNKKYQPLTYDSVQKRGLYAYALENADAYKEKCPNFFEAEIRQVMIADYRKLPEDRREVYEERASVRSAWWKKRARDKVPLFKNEPERVPRSAYELYVKESLSKESGKKAMAQLKSDWNRLSQRELDDYQQRCDAMKEGYAKRFKVFVDGLSETQLAEFRRVRGAEAPSGSPGRKDPVETSEAENGSPGEEDSDEEEDSPNLGKSGMNQPKQLQEPLNSNGNEKSRTDRKRKYSTASSASDEEQEVVVSKKPMATGKQQASPRSQAAFKAGKSSSSSSSSSSSDSEEEEEAETVNSTEVEPKTSVPSKRTLQANEKESDDDFDEDSEEELSPFALAAFEADSALSGKKTVKSPAVEARPEIHSSVRKPERKEAESDSSEDEEQRIVLAQARAKKGGKATPNPASPRKTASGRKPEKKQEGDKDEDTETPRASEKKQASSVKSSKKEGTIIVEKAARKRAEEQEKEEGKEKSRVKSTKKVKEKEGRAESPSMLRSPMKKRKHGDEAIEEDHSQESPLNASKKKKKKKKKNEVVTSTPLFVAEQLQKRRKKKGE